MIATLARFLTRRPADFIIGGADNPYMFRWFVIPRNRFFNIYRHVVVRSDDDRALHDHPWWSFSVCLDGRMYEVTESGAKLIEKGDVRLRRPADAHRLVIPEGGRCETLFITGPRVREWGFHCPQGWRHWKDFTSPADTGSVGRGCD